MGSLTILRSRSRLAEAARNMARHDLSFMAAGLAFYALLGFVPLALLIVLAYGLIADPAVAVRHVERLAGVVSSDVGQALGRNLTRLVLETGQSKGWGVAASLVLALYAGVRGARALTRALDTVHDAPAKRSFTETTLLSVGIVTAALLIALGALIAVVALGYLERLAGGLSKHLALLIKSGTWAALGTMAAAAISALYRFVPKEAPRNRRKWFTPGAIAATLLWCLTTFLLGIYVANFSRYDAIYGSAATVIVLLMWFYFSAMILLAGAELDAATDLATIADARSRD